MSEENISEKKAFYDTIGLRDLLKISPKRFIQSTSLSYARYMLYKSRGLEINMDNYYKLFINNTQFEKRYGTTKEAILKMYPYESEKKHGRTI